MGGPSTRPDLRVWFSLATRGFFRARLTDGGVCADARPGYFPSPWSGLIGAAIPAGAVGVLGTSLSGIDAAMAVAVQARFPVPKRLGFGLIPQGGISLAMAVSGVLMYADLQVGGADAEAALFTLIVMGVLLSELVGPFLTINLLRRAGELSPDVEKALARGDTRSAERQAVRTAPGTEQP